MKILGIDYGKRKVGLAFSEEEISAKSYKTLSINGLEDAVKKVKEIILTCDVEKIVIGLPESGEANTITRKFIKELSMQISLEIISVEETLSTQNANTLMNLYNISPKKKRNLEDAYSAMLLLQTYLDSH